MIREQPNHPYHNYINTLSIFTWKLLSTIRPWFIMYYMSFTRYWHPNLNIVMSAYFWYEYLRLVFCFGGVNL